MNIYVHIPFCHSKCAYCAFLSHCDGLKEDEYVDAVCAEISNSRRHCEARSNLYRTKTTPQEIAASQAPRNDVIETIYFGGGTPSIIKAENIAKIIRVISTRWHLVNNVEITLECNPEDINAKKLEKWKATGVNRLSIGIQSFNNNVRKKIGRHLTANEAIEKVKLAQKHFDNVGIDLISGLPSDSLSSFKAGSLMLQGLSHISLYDLETDNNSAIGKNPDKFDLPDENTGTEMLVSAWNLLTTLGFEQYEISNFAKEGKYCRHNLDFWEGKDYIGFGLGASSRIGNSIITNSDDFDSYLTGTSAPKTETLSQSELTRWHLVAAMRLNRPFKNQLLAAAESTNIPQELIDLKLVKTDYTLTQKGKLMYNQVVHKLIG